MLPHQFKSKDNYSNMTKPPIGNFSLWQIITVIVLLVIIVILLLFIAITLGLSVYRFPEDDSTTELNNVDIVTREDWKALPPKMQPEKLNLPVPSVIIWHTATEDCTTTSDCMYRVRVIQEFHMDSRHFNDIAYNFLIGGDGNIYEGRGWSNVGAHTYGRNNRSLGIGFIGTFERKVPLPIQLDAFTGLLKEGLKVEALREDYTVFGANELTNTTAPGVAFSELLKTWPHSTENLYSNH